MRTVITFGACVVVAAIGAACGTDIPDGPTGGAGGGTTAAQGGGGNGTGAGVEGGGGAGDGDACVLDASNFDQCTLQ